MKKFFIYYNNGDFETSSTMNTTLLHMVDVGVIKAIFDCESNVAWVRSPEGTAKEVKVHNVSGL